jgi:hypothetical protein
METIQVYKSGNSKFAFAMTDCFTNSEIVTLTKDEFLKYSGLTVLEKNYRLSNKKVRVDNNLFEKYKNK